MDNTREIKISNDKELEKKKSLVLNTINALIIKYVINGGPHGGIHLAGHANGTNMIKYIDNKMKSKLDEYITLDGYALTQSIIRDLNAAIEEVMEDEKKSLNERKVPQSNFNLVMVNNGEYSVNLSEIMIGALAIIGAKDAVELKSVVSKLNNIGDSETSIDNVISVNTTDLDSPKDIFFKQYKDSFVPSDVSEIEKFKNLIAHLDIPSEAKEELLAIIGENIKNGLSLYDIRKEMEGCLRKYPSVNMSDVYNKIFNFIPIDEANVKRASKEDIKAVYDNIFDDNGPIKTITTDAGNFEAVMRCDGTIRKFNDTRVKRVLDFCFNHKKHVVYGPLLDKKLATLMLNSGLSKNEIKENIEEYVRRTVQFINTYNSEHKFPDGTNVIESVIITEDMIIDKGEGHFVNIWEDYFKFNESEVLSLINPIKEGKTRVGKPEGVSYIISESGLNDANKLGLAKEYFLKLYRIGFDSLFDELGLNIEIYNDKDIDGYKKNIERIDEFVRAYSGKLNITSLYMNPTIKGTDLSEEEYRENMKEISDKVSAALSGNGINYNIVSYASMTSSTDSYAKENNGYGTGLINTKVVKVGEDEVRLTEEEKETYIDEKEDTMRIQKMADKLAKRKAHKANGFTSTILLSAIVFAVVLVLTFICYVLIVNGAK